MRSTRHSSFMAAAMMAAVSGGLYPGVAFSDPPRATSANTPARARSRYRRDTKLQREIAAHNEAVDARKAEKKARKVKKLGE